jgi:hypothetical protein
MSIPAIVAVCSEIVRHVARGAVHGPFRGIRRHVSHVPRHPRVFHHVPRHIPPRLEVVCHAVGAGLMGAGVAALGMTTGAALAPVPTPPALLADRGAAGSTGSMAAPGEGPGAAGSLQGLGVSGLPPGFGASVLPPDLPQPPVDLGPPEPFPSPPTSHPPPPPPRGDIPEPGIGLVLLAVAAGAGWAARRFWARPPDPAADQESPSRDP